MLRDFRRVQQFEEPDDVLHNAMMRLLQALKSAPPASAPEFFALATRQIRWELLSLAQRHARRHAVRAGDLPAEASSAASETPRFRLIEASQSTHDPSRLQLWTEFHAQVLQLPADERQVFELLWFHNLTQGEAAQALNVSVPTIKRRWAAARLRLGAALPMTV
jgi:RNA polymerase sigma-70 factor (ECF subfamily)